MKRINLSSPHNEIDFHDTDEQYMWFNSSARAALSGLNHNLGDRTPRKRMVLRAPHPPKENLPPPGEPQQGVSFHKQSG